MGPQGRGSRAQGPVDNVYRPFFCCCAGDAAARGYFDDKAGGAGRLGQVW